LRGGGGKDKEGQEKEEEMVVVWGREEGRGHFFNLLDVGRRGCGDGGNVMTMMMQAALLYVPIVCLSVERGGKK
jgi:hypothetical protein